MGSYDRPHAFGPLDLEIIDRVYEATWAQIEARYPHRDIGQDETRQKALRRVAVCSRQRRSCRLRHAVRQGDRQPT